MSFLKTMFVAVAAGLLSIGLVGTADAAKPAVTGDLIVAVDGYSATFDAVVDGRIPKDSRVEVSIACFDESGTMVVQGVTKPGTTVTVAGAECIAALRVVEMRRSGVDVLDTETFVPGVAS